MIDLSKLDWKKCELPDYEGAVLTVDYVPKIIQQVRIKNRSNIVATRTTTDAKHPWRIHDAHCSVFAFIEHILKCAKFVDAFIASEAARIAAEEDAENWTAIPYQDAEWLRDNGATVRVLDTEIREWVPFQRNATAMLLRGYSADKRTFPVGYDPTEPRWVEVENDQIVRLYNAKCATAIKFTNESSWAYVSNPNGNASFRYAIDAHTLPLGVPLHEEPKPTPTQRPCTKEFALENPGESEYNLVPYATWYPMRRYSGDSPPYQFRTTAEEPSLKLPTVKIPDSSEWRPPKIGLNGRYGLRLRFVEDGENALCYVPSSKEYRDAMAACVAAYDELHGVARPTIAIEAKPQSWEYQNGDQLHSLSTGGCVSVVGVNSTVSIPFDTGSLY